MMTDRPFKVGDRVNSKAFGAGSVTDVLPISKVVIVKFDTGEEHYFSKSGGYNIDPTSASNIYFPSKSDAPEEMLNKHDAVNPAHYNVEGVQQPIEVMRKLFTNEQLEGFLWGNIIKYAHRYGRKGSKKETAGKIAQYAKWLEEVAE